MRDSQPPDPQSYTSRTMHVTVYATGRLHSLRVKYSHTPAKSRNNRSVVVSEQKTVLTDFVPALEYLYAKGMSPTCERPCTCMRGS